MRLLFRERDEIDAKITAILEGGALPDKEPMPETPIKRKGRKPKPEQPTKEKRTYAKRENKPTRYVCKDCDDTFISSHKLLDVECPTCSSRHIEKAN